MVWWYICVLHCCQRCARFLAGTMFVPFMRLLIWCEPLINAPSYTTASILLWPSLYPRFMTNLFSLIWEVRVYMCGAILFPFWVELSLSEISMNLFETRLLSPLFLRVLVMFSSLVDWYVSKGTYVAALLAWVKIVDLSVASEGNCTTFEVVWMYFLSFY